MTNLAARITRVPRTCVLEITTACNLRCVHCELSAGEPRPYEMQTGEILEVAAYLAAAGCTNVSLTGGEPLVRGDWPEIARGFTRLGIQVKIVTNGVLLDDGAIELMAGAGVSGAAVSLDGTREVHDAIRVPAGRMGSRHDVPRAVDLGVLQPRQTSQRDHDTVSVHSVRAVGPGRETDQTGGDEEIASPLPAVFA